MNTAKIFRNGQSQAVRLPKQYRFRGKSVFIHRVGNAVVLLPEEDAWRPLRESLTMFSDDFGSERRQPPTESRESLDK